MRTVYLPGDEPPAVLPLMLDEGATPVDSSERHWVYDTREPLETCTFTNLNRQIGVAVSKPFHHHGLNAPYVDVHRETIAVTTTSSGTCYPAEQADEQTRAAMDATVADLTRVIEELIDHRDRLAAEQNACSTPRQGVIR